LLPIASWHQCDASNKEQVDKLLDNINPDIIYHLTSDSRGWQDPSLIPYGIKNDIEATTNVLISALRCQVKRVVVTGSFEEPRGTARDAIPSSPYGAAKWVSCGYARMISVLYKLPITVLRPMMIYGPGQKNYKVIPYTICQLLKGEPARLTSGQRMLDWVYVDDVIDAFLRAGTAPLNDASSIDIGTGQLVRLRDLLMQIAEIIGRPDLLEFGALEDRRMEQEEAAQCSDAEVKLGWRAYTPLTKGLLKTVDWYRSAARDSLRS